MLLGEPLDKNSSLVRASLDLIEASIHESHLKELVDEALASYEPTDLAKGMFISVKSLMVAMRMSYNFSSLCELLNTDIKQKALKGKDVSVDYKVMRILEIMEEGEGGSFYLQIHTLQKINETLMVLIGMFKRMSFLYYQNDAERDSLETIFYLRETLNRYALEEINRKQEQNKLIAVLRAEKLAAQEALHLTEVLDSNFTFEVTETGAKVAYLKTEVFQKEHVRKAINVPHQVELLKGLCLVTCVFLSRNLLEAGNSILTILEARRNEIEADSLDSIVDEEDMQIMVDAIDLLESVAVLDEENFYQKAYALDEIEDVILSLSTSFYRTYRYGADQDISMILSDFKELLK